MQPSVDPSLMAIYGQDTDFGGLRKIVKDNSLRQFDYAYRVSENYCAYLSGPVAQLGARFHGMEEVVGSNPTRSTKPSIMPSVYILQRHTTGKFYIGCTNDVQARLLEHQRGHTVSTRSRGPWVLIFQEHFETLVEARRRERQLKSWKSHRSIQELIDSRQN